MVAYAQVGLEQVVHPPLRDGGLLGSVREAVLVRREPLNYRSAIYP